MRIQTKGLAPEWWTPPSEIARVEKAKREGVETSDPLQVLLKPLTSMQMLTVTENVSSAGGNIKVNRQGVVDAVRDGMSNWRGAQDENDKELAYSPDNRWLLPYYVLHEIAMEIIQISSLSGDDRKNSP